MKASKYNFLSKSQIRNCFLQLDNNKNNNLSTKILLLNNIKNFISNFIANHKSDLSSLQIGLYYPIKNEPDILNLILKDVKNYNPNFNKIDFSLPFVLSKNQRTMVFKQIATVEDIDIYSSKIPQPQYNCKDVLPDIVFTPGVCFTTQKHRVGYAMGFYDRFFAQNNKITKIGICFDNFLIDIEQNNNNLFSSFDIKMDFIITQSGIY
jgi:5,10-methenyltetrahydrofolate synthetase